MFISASVCLYVGSCSRTKPFITHFTVKDCLSPRHRNKKLFVCFLFTPGWLWKRLGKPLQWGGSGVTCRLSGLATMSTDYKYFTQIPSRYIPTKTKLWTENMMINPLVRFKFACRCVIILIARVDIQPSI